MAQPLELDGFKPIRDASALAKFGPEERANWQSLWRDLEQLRARAMAH